MSKYVTAQGDTWDQIAFKKYDNELQTPALMVTAACDLGIECLARWRFEQGFSLDIPELVDSGDYGTQQNSDVPAWRR